MGKIEQILFLTDFLYSMCRIFLDRFLPICQVSPQIFLLYHFRSIDFALEWLQLESGKALYKQNDEANSTYVVLSGRLRSVIRQENSKKTLVAEYGRGEF